MAIECGYALRVENEGKPTVFRGEINLGKIDGEFYLIPHAQVRNPGRSPEYAVKMKGRDGAERTETQPLTEKETV